MNVLKLSPIILSVIALSACSLETRENTGKATITVSIEPQRQILELLASDRYEVVTLLSRGSDPETFDPPLAVRRTADNADAYFSISAFPFEGKIKESLPESVAFIDVSTGIEPLYGTHGLHHSHGHRHAGQHDDMADPHIWTSVVNMRQIATNMAEALCKIDSAGTDVYRERLAKIVVHMDSLDNSFKAKVRESEAFAIWHPSLSYFARDYNIEQIAVGYESKEMPAKRLRAVIDSAKCHNTKVLFFQKEYDSRQVESLNEAIGSRLVEIDPLAYDWEKELTKIADELARP